MTDYEKLLLAARYSPTTVGNMILNPKGAYASADAIKLLERQITTLQAELEQCRKDAERYAWLRQANACFTDDTAWYVGIDDSDKNGIHWIGSDLDAAIDKAMESGE